MPYLVEEEQLQALLARAVEAGLGRRASPAWTAPFLLLLLLLCGALLGAACYASLVHRAEQRRRLTAAAAAADGENLSRFCDALPAWALHPDASSCVWVNAIFSQLWPHLERGATRFLLADDFLESQINATSFWRPAMLRSSYFKVQGVVLGQTPPRVTGIKAFPKQGGLQDEALMEYSFVWDSRMEVKLLVTLLGKALAKAKARTTAQGGGGDGSGGEGGGGEGGGGGGKSTFLGVDWQGLLSRVSRVRVGVSEFAVRGTLRLSLKPLLDDFPFAGSAKISLVGTPEYSYHISVLGGDPYLVPGVKLWVDSFIKESVLQPYTFPDGFVYDLSTLSVAPFEKPEGLLEVAVLEAEGVPRMDLFGKSDPFVRLWIRDSQKLQTTIKSGTLSPRWNETFTVLVHSSAHQQLSLALYDSDLWPNTDDLIGRLSLPLASLDLSPGAVNDLWLEVPRNGKKPRQQRKPQRVHATRVVSGEGSGRPAAAAAAAAAGPGGSAGSGRGGSGGAAAAADSPRVVAGREDTADVLSRQSALGQLSPGAASAAGAAEPGGLQGSLFTSTSGALQQLRQLAVNPLDVLRSKSCMLHVVATFYPLSEQDIVAAEREAGRQHREGQGAPPSGGPSRAASLLVESPVSNMLRGGVLYVYLDRASNLSSSTGFTRNMRVDVAVGGQQKSTERGKVPFRHRSNPVFDETVELVVPGAVAQQREAVVEIEVWVQHFILKASYKGRITVPLHDVIQRKKVRDTWTLRDTPSGRGGTLTAELSWLSTLSM